MKRVLSIQDISCLGKCSLTVALPIISAMGIETSIVPTAVLSTHTKFNNFTFRDLTGDMEGIKSHWLSEGFRFDAIYTGYLGSREQVDIVSDFFTAFGNSENYIIVDPAMADNGKCTLVLQLTLQLQCHSFVQRQILFYLIFQRHALCSTENMLEKMLLW